MSDAVPPSEPVHPSPGAAPEEAHGPEVELDVHAFLPEGVVLGAADDADDADQVETDETDEADGDEGDGGEGDDRREPAPAAEAAPDLAALDQVQADLDAVDAAIAALDAGTYGIDPATGEPFDDEVLAADPTRLR